MKRECAISYSTKNLFIQKADSRKADRRSVAFIKLKVSKVVENEEFFT